MIEKKTLERQAGFGRAVRTPFISFLTTFLMLVLYFILSRIAPFGSVSALVSDMEVQYAPFLIGYKEHLTSGDMLSYSFLLGMGKNTLGMFAYYLASPFSLISFLFPKEMIGQAVVIIQILYLSTAASFMTVFLRKRSGRDDKAAAIFGVMYAMSSYAMLYMMNIMWLPGFMLLPLLLFFAEQLIEDHRKWVRLVPVMFLLFVSGYYVAYMVGIFSFVYLLIRLIEERRPGRDGKETARIVFRFIGCAVIAAGLSAVILIPAGLDTLGNPDYRRTDLVLSGRFVITGILDQLFCGTFDSLHSNKPFIYSGLITTFFCILYFLNPGIAKRSKIVFASVLSLMVLNFHLNLLDYVWHLFDLPNWFQYRNAFLFVCILILYAYLSFARRDALNVKQCVTAGLIVLGVLIFVYSFGDMKTESLRFYTNLVIGGLYFALIIGLVSPKWPEVIAGLKGLALPAMIVLILVDVGIANPMVLRLRSFGMQTRQAVQIGSDIKWADQLANEAGRIQEAEGKAFQRIEIDGKVNSVEAYNAGSTLGHPMISDFQSGANKHLHRFLKQLGFSTNYNYFSTTHSYTSVVPDSFLGISHILSERPDCAGMRHVMSVGETNVYELSVTGNVSPLVKRRHTSVEIHLFQNDAALPVLFTVRPDAAAFDYYSPEKDTVAKNLFEFQNRWLTSMFESFPENDVIYYPAGVREVEVFNAIMSDVWEAELKDEDLKDWDPLGNEPIDIGGEGVTHYFQITPKAGISILYRVVAGSEDPLYFSLPYIAQGFEGDVRLNGRQIGDVTRSEYSKIILLGRFAPGEVIEVEVLFEKEHSVVSLMDAFFYHCDTEKFFGRMAEQDASAGISGLKVGDGSVFAEVSLSDDRLLMTTVPFEKGWTLWVDGEKTPIVSYQGALIAVPLTAGQHSVRLEFRAPGVMTGEIVSILSAVAFFALIVVDRFSRRKQK
ncbi:MAG: YfhO family protein [Clostridiaceae bacterium]|nr:YfhO family protein [Clostridiaceae bacterium]